MLSEVFIYVGISLGALLPIVNPLSVAPVFLSLTGGDLRNSRRQHARRAAIYTACILLTCLVAGAMILRFFGITLPILRIGGGLVVTRVGFGMLNPPANPPVSESEHANAEEFSDVAFTPISMPLLAGPGSIAATIAMATEATSVASHIGIGIGIVILSVIVWIVLRSSTFVLDLIGSTGMNIVTRLMGLVLVCIGVSFVMTGFLQGLTSEPVTGLLQEWLRALQVT